MKTAVVLLTLVFFVVSMLVLTVASEVKAQPACSNATLTGTYAIRGIGFFQGAPPSAVETHASRPSAFVGIFVANGMGDIFGTAVGSFNGLISGPNFFAATYVVNADCTGLIMPGGGVAFLVLIERGDRLFAINTFPGSVETVEAIKMRDQPACSLSSVKGTYAVRTTGFFQAIDPTTGNPVHTHASSPSASLGIVTSDGAGNIFGEFTASGNGFISAGITDTGTYTVNPDCTGSATFASGGTSYFVIVNRGAEVFAINTVPGSVETAVAIRQ